MHRVLLLLAALVVASPRAGAQDAPARAEVVLVDGQVLRGTLVSRDDQQLVLELGNGTRLSLPAEVVKVVRRGEEVPDEGAWGPDPNRSRYLYSPTAFNLGAGHGYVAQRELVLTSAAVGITDFLDVEVGTVIPMMFTGDPVGVAGLKLATPITERVRITAGAQAFVIPEIVAGFAFAGVTIGDADQHVTVAGGGALEFTQGDLGAWVGTLSAAKRLGPGTALVTENWFMVLDGEGPWGGPFFAVPSGGVRVFGPKFAVDLGLVVVVTGAREIPVLPIPWIGFAWNWSLNRD